MARASFGGGVADFVFETTAGRLVRAASGEITVWTAETGGTQVTDLLLDGQPVTAIPVGVDGQVPTFQGPDGVLELWAASGGGPRVQLISVAGVLAEVAVISGLTGEDATVAALVTTPGSEVGDSLIASGVAPLGIQTGVDPTGVSECAAAINTALNAFAALGVKASAQGTFKIASTVTISSDCDLSAATFNYTGTSGTAVRIGTATSGAWVDRLNVRAPKVVATAKTTTGWAQVAGTIGVEVCNLQGAPEVVIPRVKNFEAGFRVTGKGQGSVHNTFLIGHLENNKINSMVDADATGWSNSNVYVGGRYSHESGEGTAVSGTRHIEMGVCPNPVNGNTWIAPSIEGNTPEFHAIIAGSYNVITNGRWESTAGPKVKWASDSTRNTILYGYGADSITETFVSGAAGSNAIIGTTRAYLARSGSTKGVEVLENASSSANPALVVMEAGARVAGSDPATAYAVTVGAQALRGKRASDTNDRYMLDPVNGRVYVGPGNAALSKYIGNVGTAIGVGGADWVPVSNNAQDLGISGLAWRDIYQAGFHEFIERASDPAAPAANAARLYVKDNGSGKTQLCVRFNTGAVQVIATEP